MHGKKIHARMVQNGWRAFLSSISSLPFSSLLIFSKRISMSQYPSEWDNWPTHYEEQASSSSSMNQPKRFNFVCPETGDTGVLKLNPNADLEQVKSKIQKMLSGRIIDRVYFVELDGQRVLFDEVSSITEGCTNLEVTLVPQNDSGSKFIPPISKYFTFFLFLSNSHIHSKPENSFIHEEEGEIHER